MKEHQIDKKYFIGGWYIDKKICEKLMNSFKKTPAVFKEKGRTGIGETVRRDKKIKDSVEMTILLKNENYPLNKYKDSLQECLENYQKKFPEVKNFLQKFQIAKTGYNIQYYRVGGGFGQWHCERTRLIDTDRILVFMTYLNDVPDGGTYFKYQDLKIPAKKGLTIIWPSDWTHTHKGEISKKHEKCIITGWYTFTKNNEPGVLNVPKP
tara:strand:+ start:48 stop:674 length:627 start_codon:yes stop_codon:yes gene_type:complete